MFVDALVVARFESNLFNRFANEVGNHQTILQAVARGPGFLSGDLDAQLNLFRIVRHDFGADAILQRRNNLAARGVILRVRREHQHHVQRQTHRITLNLHVAFLHDVEKTNLNLAGEVGQLVDRKDAAIRARQQAVMNRQLVAEQVTTLRGFDRIDVADDVGNGDIRRRELFDKARVATDPIDAGRVAMQLNCLPAVGADGMKRIVVNFRAGNDRNLFVKQIGELANDATLCLAAQAEQNQIVPRQDRIDELRHHRFVIADDAGKSFSRRLSLQIRFARISSLTETPP